MEISFRRSATKHRVPRIVSAEIWLRATHRLMIPPPGGSDHKEPRYLVIGTDHKGRCIEVIAIRTGPDAWKIIHAMPVRKKTLRLFENE